MESMEGMTFHSAEREVERLEERLATIEAERNTIKRICDATQDSLLVAQAENADLRRQLATKDEALDRMGLGYSAIGRQLAECQAELDLVSKDRTDLSDHIADLHTGRTTETNFWRWRIDNNR